MAVAPPEKRIVWNEPMLIPSIGVAAGVLLERLVPFTLVEAGVAGGLFALLALAPGLVARRRGCAGLACCALGLGTAVWHRPGPAPVIEASASEAVILEGCVVEPSVFSENREQFTMELAPGARGRVSLNLREGQTAPRLRYGQRVARQPQPVRPVWRPPPAPLSLTRSAGRAPRPAPRARARAAWDEYRYLKT